MNSNLTRYYFAEEHELFRQSLRKFLEKEVLPHIDQWEAQEQVPRELWRKFAEQGFLGFHYPSEYGGANLDFFYTVVFTEEVSRVFSGGFGVIPLVTQYMSTPYIYKYGSEYLRQKYLPPVIRGEKIAAIGISEPGAGSDVANIQTKATREGDWYVVSGEKTFISNGYCGDFVVLVVKTQPEAGLNGISLLVVDLDSPGITRNKLRKLGWHASDTAELFFDRVRVPAENLIGEEGKGFFYLMEGLPLERLVGLSAPSPAPNTSWTTPLSTWPSDMPSDGLSTASRCCGTAWLSCTPKPKPSKASSTMPVDSSPTASTP